MIRNVHPGSGSRIRILIFTYNGFRIPYPGVKKSPDPGSSTLFQTIKSSAFLLFGYFFLDNWKTEEEFYGNKELLSPSNEENTVTEGKANGYAKECVDCEGEPAGYD
jgi:hypothetical protein